MRRQQNNHQNQFDANEQQFHSATALPADISGGLGELLSLIWWNKLWILLWVGVCVAAVLVYILLSTRSYTATAHLLMETRSPQILRSMSLIPGLTSDAPLIESHVELMRSNRIIIVAIQELNKERGKIDSAKNTTKEGINKQAVAAAAPVRPTPTEAEIKRFNKRLAINRKGVTYLVVIKFTDEDRQRAAYAANAMADSYISYLKNNRLSITQEANKWLHGRIKILRKDLHEAEEKVLRFESENKLSLIGGSTLFERELTDAANQIAQAKTNAVQALARLQQVEKLAENPERLTSMEEVLLSDVIRQYRTQLSEVQRELDKVTNLYGLNNEKARAARANLKSVKQQLQSEVRRIVEKLRNDFEIARNQVKIMKRQIAKIEQQVSKRHKQKVILAELRRQSSAISQLYVSLLTRAKETKSQESLLLIEARIISRAVAPILPSYPRKGMALALALILGLSAGTVTSVIVGHLRPYIRKPEQIENFRGLASPVTIPHMNGKPAWCSAYDLGRLTGRILSGTPFTDKKELQRHVMESPNSRYSQSLFTLFNIIDENSENSSGGKVIAVISARDDEGKSTTAINLADQAALAGRKTLLLDGDLRQARLTADINLENKPDLLDAASTDDDLTNFLPRVEKDGFWFCAAPPTEKYQRPMNLLASDDVGRLLGRARGEFEIVLIDTSSLLDEVDAQGIVHHCDLVALVIGWGMTTPTEIEQVFERARVRDRAQNLILAILNKGKINI